MGGWEEGEDYPQMKMMDADELQKANKQTAKKK
jgi:hypothetical protein